MKFQSLLIIAVIFQSVTFISYVHKKILEENLPRRALSNSQPFILHQNSTIEKPNYGKSSSSHTNSIGLQKNNDAVMIIAAMPLDERHLVALWSELECFVGSIDHIVISSAYWAKPILNRLLIDVRKNIPQFASGQVTIEAHFYDNQRYDAGLWCDALQGLKERYDDFLLLNDSIFALREFNGILDTLRSKNLLMTSLNYNVDEKDRTWLESVFRGFSKSTGGLSVFMNHSCVPQEHKSFCKNLTRKNKRKATTVQRKRKRCIIEYHEVAMAWQFPRPEQQVEGLYPGTVPEDMKSKETSIFPTWVVHAPFWKEVLLKKFDFPAAKVNQESMIATTDDPLLDKCTRFLDRSLLGEIDFSQAKRSIQY